MSLSMKLLGVENAMEITELTQLLNPELSPNILLQRQQNMFHVPTYRCFGLYKSSELVGVCSGWISVRLYCGQQLEIDNVVIAEKIQSAGIGGEFLDLIEAWALQHQCETIELNTYVQNSRSHKFYYNKGYKILGFHFQKEIEA